MKALAPHDRPREKLERLGPSALGDNELLALVLGSGSRSHDALTVANQLLAATGGVHQLARASAIDLQQQSGIGRARSAQVLAAIELGRRSLVRGVADRPRLNSPQQLALFLIPQFGSGVVEQFGVVSLDTRHRLIRARVLSVGSLDTAVVHPREVFREAATACAAAIVLFHNHPSGDPTPSREDLHLTTRMIRAGEVMGIPIIDHLILTERGYFSVLEAGGFGKQG